MYQFASTWTDEIADESTKPEYQNATVTLIDSSLVTGDYDPETGDYTVTGDPEFWSGRARIMPMRWGVNRENSDFANSNTQTAVLVQFGKNEDFGGTPNTYRVKKGVGMRVDASPDNPSLETMYFTCTGESQGSNAAARTLEFSQDGDAVMPRA